MVPCGSFNRISILDSAAAAARPENRDTLSAAVAAAAERKNWRREFITISVRHGQILTQTAFPTSKKLRPRGPATRNRKEGLTGWGLATQPCNPHQPLS